MCTLLIDYLPDHEWPVLLAGNRDEMRDRPWRPPGRHWPLQPEICAGFDELGEGTWFGVADHGVAAVVLNRRGTLGPLAHCRSRGELVLEALEHSDAATAAQALSELNPQAYRGFNLVIADPTQVYWLSHQEGGMEINVQALSPGLHMIEAGELNDPASSRINHWLPRFRALPRPAPIAGQWQSHSWSGWRELLAAREFPSQAGPRAAMNVDYQGRFGTVCSQALALPRYPGHGHALAFFFSPRALDEADFSRVENSR